MSRRVRLARNAALMWLVLLMLAFANGALRELLLARLFGPAALPLSGATALLAFAIAIVLFVRHSRPAPREAAVIGTAWLAATVLLEFVLFVAQGRPGAIVDVFTWRAIAGGNLFAVLVALVALAPVAFAWRLSR